MNVLHHIRFEFIIDCVSMGIYLRTYEPSNEIDTNHLRIMFKSILIEIVFADDMSI